MAGTSLDNLNFKVILDDKDFQSKVRADIKAAQDMNTQLSKLLEAQKKYDNASSGNRGTQRANNVRAEAQAYQELAKAMAAAERARKGASTNTRHIAQDYKDEAKALEQILRQVRAVTSQMNQGRNYVDQQNASLRTQSGIMRELAGLTATYLSARGLFNFGRSIATVTGEFEMQRVALRNILQDISGADRIFKQLQNLAVQSPYTFQDLTSYAKQLAAFSIPMESLYDTTKMLADVSAGLGVDMSRMILAYGQVRAASVLRGQEIRQFTEAGVPLLQKLAEQFSVLEGRVVSTGEVFDKVSKRMVSFEMVDKVLRDLTSEGGQFFDMQSVLADTLKGKLMKLKDAYQQMLFQVGESNGGFFHGIADTLILIVRNVDILSFGLTGLIATFGAYQAVALIVGARTAMLTKTFALCTAASNALKTAWATNPFGLVVAGATAVTTAFVSVLAYADKAKKAYDALDKTAASYASSLNDELGKLYTLKQQYEHYSKDVENLAKVKQTILSQYDEYLSEADREAVITGNLAAVYDKLTASIKNSARARAMEEGAKDLSNTLKEGESSIRDQLTKWMDRKGIKDYATRIDLMNYIFGFDADELGEQAKKYVDKAIATLQKKTAREASNKGVTMSGQVAIYNDIFESDSDIIERLRGQVADLNKSYENQMQILGDRYEHEERRREETGQKLISWQEKANETLKTLYGEDAKARDEYIKDSSVDFSNYVDGLRNKVKELSGKVADASTAGYEDSQVEMWQRDIKAATTILDTLGKSYTEVKQKAKSATGGGGSEDPNKERIASLEAEAKTVDKLISAYTKLKDIVPESILPELMAELFPSVDEAVVKNINYESQIADIAARLASLGEEGQKKAAELLVRNGQDATDAFLKAYKAGETFYKSMREWMDKDFNITGTGAVFDISKTLAEKTSKDISVNTKSEELKAELALLKSNARAEYVIRKKYGDEFWEAYISKGEKAIDELADKEKEVNRKTAEEKISGLAEKYASENLGLDFSNIGKKSLKGLSELKDRIKGELAAIDLDNLELPDSVRQSINDAGISLDGFKKALSQLLDTNFDKIDKQVWTEIGKGLKTGAKWASEFGKNIESLGEAADSPSLKNLGEELQGLSSIATRIGEGATAGGMYGAIAGGIVGFAESLSEALTENATAAKQAQASADEYAHSLNLLKLELNDNYDSIWGERGIAKMAELFSDSRDAMKMYREELQKVNKLYDDLSAVDIFGGSMSNFSASFDDSLKGLQKMQVLTKDRNWLTNWLGFKDEYTQLGKLAPDLWDSDGAFNVEAAEKFIATNKGLTEEQTRQIQQVIDLKKKYDELEESIDDAVSSLVGSLASDLVEQMIQNFDEAGDAVSDLSESFESLGDTILKSLMQSFIIDDILEEFTPRVKEMFDMYSKGEAGAEQLASGLGTLVGDIKDDLQTSGDFINSMIAAFRDNGLLSSSESSSESGSTLTTGIESVTEDTASLLASYINAIRADVSFSKVQREGMSADLKTILGLLPVTPTLTEYLTAIQSNTYNSAMAAQEILAELRSVVAPYSGGGYAINVNN